MKRLRKFYQSPSRSVQNGSFWYLIVLECLYRVVIFKSHRLFLLKRNTFQVQNHLSKCHSSFSARADVRRRDALGGLEMGQSSQATTPVRVTSFDQSLKRRHFSSASSSVCGGGGRGSIKGCVPSVASQSQGLRAHHRDGAMKVTLSLFLSLAALLSCSSATEVICYWGSWSHYRTGMLKRFPVLCT